ncbi:uncharacterized protein RJT21DRAFT_116344 [Scheffersomyces amazonensis]|uniref:uncharacterized protein n=1 Tax=Scheffersomyces amazonensis TaxID=1078765 RepID=UPI00315D28A7
MLFYIFTILITVFLRFSTAGLIPKFSLDGLLPKLTTEPSNGDAGSSSAGSSSAGSSSAAGSKFDLASFGDCISSNVTDFNTWFECVTTQAESDLLGALGDGTSDDLISQVIGNILIAGP